MTEPLYDFTEQPPHSIIGAGEAMEILGCSRVTMDRLMLQHKLRPIRKLPGGPGALIFHRSHVEEVAAERLHRPEATA
jgi:predicted DNA-binding transcriptional regulator AlpA